MPTKSVMECTGRYNSLVRNGLGGTIDKPCANSWNLQFYCDKTDVEAWLNTAETLKARLRAEWNDTARRFVIPPEVVNYVTNVENEYCDSDEYGVCTKKWLPEPSWIDTGWNQTASATIAKWCARSACALEILDNVRNLEGPVEAAQQNSEPELDEHIAKGIGALGEGLGEALGEVGKGTGEALGELGRGTGDAVGALGQGTGDAVGAIGQGTGAGLKGLGTGLAWLPVGLGIAGAAALVVGGIYFVRMNK